jgi:predicted benzoate:H+ symporter BenE
LADLQFNADNVTACITAVVFSVTGAAILFANVALKANLSTYQAASWVMSLYLIGGTFSIIMSLYYKQPFYFAPSLSALLIMGPMFTMFTLSEMVAGYLIAGVIYLFLVSIRRYYTYS